jgi:hypothetical protein
MTPDRAKFNKEVEKGLLDRGVNTPIRAMTEQETMEQRIKIQDDQIASLKRQIGRLETQLANELLVDDGSPLTPHGEAIAAGDGTLHGAIDYWQQQAFTMAAGQCIVTNGGLMADDHGNQYCDMERQRDEWKRKAEEAARDAEKLTLDAVEQRLLNWRQSTMNKSGDRLALDDFMGKESIDDLVDYVCDEFAAIAAKGGA